MVPNADSSEKPIESAASSAPGNPAVRQHGVVAVVPRDGRLLVIKRSQLVTAPGAYCFPGGGVEQGETEPKALKREMREELNVDCAPVRKLWHSVTVRSVSLAWWLDTIDDAKLVPNPAEVELAEFLTLDDIRRLPTLLDSNREFLQAKESGAFRLDLPDLLR